MDRQKHFF